VRAPPPGSPLIVATEDGRGRFSAGSRGEGEAQQRLHCSEQRDSDGSRCRRSTYLCPPAPSHRRARVTLSRRVLPYEGSRKAATRVALLAARKPGACHCWGPLDDDFSDSGKGRGLRRRVCQPLRWSWSVAMLFSSAPLHEVDRLLRGHRRQELRVGAASRSSHHPGDLRWGEVLVPHRARVPDTFGHFPAEDGWAVRSVRS